MPWRREKNNLIVALYLNWCLYMLLQQVLSIQAFFRVNIKQKTGFIYYTIEKYYTIVKQKQPSIIVATIASCIDHDDCF